MHAQDSGLGREDGRTGQEAEGRDMQISAHPQRGKGLLLTDPSFVTLTVQLSPPDQQWIENLPHFYSWPRIRLLYCPINTQPSEWLHNSEGVKGQTHLWPVVKRLKDRRKSLIIDTWKKSVCRKLTQIFGTGTPSTSPEMWNLAEVRLAHLSTQKRLSLEHPEHKVYSTLCYAQKCQSGFFPHPHLSSSPYHIPQAMKKFSPIQRQRHLLSQFLPDRFLSWSKTRDPCLAGSFQTHGWTERTGTEVISHLSVMNVLTLLNCARALQLLCTCCQNQTQINFPSQWISQ